MTHYIIINRDGRRAHDPRTGKMFQTTSYVRAKSLCEWLGGGCTVEEV